MGMPQKRPRMHDGHTRLYRRMKLKRKTLDLDQVSKTLKYFGHDVLLFIIVFCILILKMNNNIVIYDWFAYRLIET